MRKKIDDIRREGTKALELLFKDFPSRESDTARLRYLVSRSMDELMSMYESFRPMDLPFALMHDIHNAVFIKYSMEWTDEHVSY